MLILMRNMVKEFDLDQTDLRPAPRRPVEEITYWDTWKEVAP